MTLMAIIYALGLPSLLGMLLISSIVPAAVAGRPSLVTGYGLVSGLILVTLLMRTADFIGLPLTIGYTSGAAAIFAGLLLLLRQR